MVNICIDGNYWFHKTLGIFSGYSSNNPGEILKTKSDQAMYIRKIVTDLTSSLRLLPMGGRLIFTSDSRSWRKDIEIEDGGYKLNRIKDEEIDWTIFYELLSNLGNHLEKNGFIYSKVDFAEGDDILLYWANKFNSIGENCIIISGDKDLHQLVNMNKDIWTIVWNSNSKNNTLSVPEGWEELYIKKDSISEVSIFNMNEILSPDRDKLKDFIKKVKIEEIDKKNFILNKILIGDKGDNVPSVWNYTKNNKIYKITPKSAEKIYELFLESKFYNLQIEKLYDNDEFLSWIAPIILRISKDIDSSSNREKVKENIKRNFKIMWLDNLVIPDNVSNACKNEIDRGMNLNKKNISLDRIKILEGTDWLVDLNQSNFPSSLDPFAHLNI